MVKSTQCTEHLPTKVRQLQSYSRPSEVPTNCSSAIDRLASRDTLFLATMGCTVLKDCIQSTQYCLKCCRCSQGCYSAHSYLNTADMVKMPSSSAQSIRTASECICTATELRQSARSTRRAPPGGCVPVLPSMRVSVLYQSVYGLLLTPATRMRLECI